MTDTLRAYLGSIELKERFLEEIGKHEAADAQFCAGV